MAKTNSHEQTRPKSNIVILKLCTGDEVVGDCLGEDPERTFLVIKSPMVLSEVMDPANHTVSISLSKFIMFGNHEVVPIRHQHIISLTGVIPELEEFYYSSLIFNQRIAAKEIAAEVSRANQATRQVISGEQPQEDDSALNFEWDEEEELLLTRRSGNTTIH